MVEVARGGMKTASRIIKRVAGHGASDDCREIGTPAWARTRRESMQRDYEAMKEIAVRKRPPQPSINGA